MKKALLVFILIASASQLKAQALKIDTSANSLKKYFSKPLDVPFKQFAPQLRLNDLNQQPLSVAVAKPFNAGNIDNMPIVRPQGNYNMPVAKLPGNSKMPVIDLSTARR